MPTSWLRFLIAASLLIPGQARARTQPNPDGIAGPMLGREGRGRGAFTEAGASTGSAAAPASVSAVPVPLPSGAVQIDSTYYDLQDLGSLGTRLVITVDGKVHAAWEDDFCNLASGGCPPNPNDPIPFPQRGMGYAYRSAAGTWTNLGKVRQPQIACPQCVPDAMGGFGTLAITPAGRAAISQHMNEDGCDLRGDFYLENAPGGASWTAYLTPIQSPSFQFPQVVSLPNGSFVLLGEVPRVVGNCLHCGVNEFRVSRLAAAGTPFTCPTGWQCGPWTAVAPSTLFRTGAPAFPSLAAASDGRVGIAVTDFGGDVFLVESRDGTFGAGTITIRNLTQYSDASITQTDSSSAEYRPYIHCHLAYNDTTPNVVWSELQARRSGSDIVYVDWRSRIRHWSPNRGVSTVKRVAAGEADGYANVDESLNGPLAGFNTISVDWPQVGFSTGGLETFVVWARFVDSEVDPTADAGLPGIVTGIGYGDIACSLTRTGEGWSAPQNLTATPKTDERYPSIAARNDGGRAHVLFQASATDQAGVVQAQDRGTSGPLLVRRIAYLERPLSASTVAVEPGPPASGPTLRIFPNPASGRLRFALAPPAGREAATVLVYSVAGRLVARLPLAAGATVEWDGRDRSGRPVPSGLYLAKIEGGRSGKFMLLR